VNIAANSKQTGTAPQKGRFLVYTIKTNEVSMCVWILGSIFTQTSKQYRNNHGAETLLLFLKDLLLILGVVWGLFWEAKREQRCFKH